MKDVAAIDFACNDPDNGLFAGRAAMACYGNAELAAPNFDHGFAFTEQPGFIRIHRRKFRIEGSREWIGNWCWNRYFLPRGEAKRLLLTLREHGWAIECGPVRFFDWWEATPTNPPIDKGSE